MFDACHGMALLCLTANVDYVWHVDTVFEILYASLHVVYRQRCVIPYG